MPGGEPKQRIGFGRTGHADIAASDAVGERVHQLRLARDVDGTVQIGNDGQPAARFVRLLAVVDLAAHTVFGEYLLERAEVLGEPAGVDEMEGAADGMVDVEQEVPIGTDAPLPLLFDRGESRQPDRPSPGWHGVPDWHGVPNWHGFPNWHCIHDHSSTRCPRPAATARVASACATGISVMIIPLEKAKTRSAALRRPGALFATMSGNSASMTS